MRIGLITTKLNFKTGGGSVTDLHLKARGLAELGHEVFVVTTRSPLNSIEGQLPYRVFEENISAGNFVRLQYEAYRVIKKYEDQADVFYIDGNNFLYGGGFYKLLGGKTPILVFFNMKLNCWHDPETRVENFFSRAKRRLRFFLEHRLGVPIVNRMEFFIYNTPMLADVYYGFGHPKGRSGIIEDMVNTLEIAKGSNINLDSIKSRQADPKEIVIYCSGRLLKEKGFDLVIQAVNSIKEKDKYRVIIGGNGPDEERLRKMTKDLNLEKNIHFAGWIEKEKMHENFSRAHIFVFPRWWPEYGSVVLTEAMALGLPCIVPAGGALAWLSKGASLSFEVDNYKDLANKIEGLGVDADPRIRLATGGIKKAEELDYKNLASSLEKIMLGLVESGWKN